MNQVMRKATGRQLAEAELAGFRARLFDQSDLVSVCDLACGQELTPRAILRRWRQR